MGLWSLAPSRRPSFRGLVPVRLMVRVVLAAAFKLTMLPVQRALAMAHFHDAATESHEIENALRYEPCDPTCLGSRPCAA